MARVAAGHLRLMRPNKKSGLAAASFKPEG